MIEILHYLKDPKLLNYGNRLQQFEVMGAVKQRRAHTEHLLHIGEAPRSSTNTFAKHCCVKAVNRT